MTIPKFVEERGYPIWNERGVVMGVRDMDRFLERWEMDVPGVRPRRILAPAPRGNDGTPCGF